MMGYIKSLKMVSDRRSLSKSSSLNVLNVMSDRDMNKFTFSFHVEYC